MTCCILASPPRTIRVIQHYVGRRLHWQATAPNGVMGVGYSDTEAIRMMLNRLGCHEELWRRYEWSHGDFETMEFCPLSAD